MREILADTATKLEHLGVPNVAEVALRRSRGEPIESAYTLSDMADDAAGLLDALQIESSQLQRQIFQAVQENWSLFSRLVGLFKSWSKLLFQLFVYFEQQF